MIKSILKASLLIFGLVFLSSANAEICKEEYNNQRFDHATIWKDSGHTLYCYYCSSMGCPGSFYLKLGYEPKDGPWVSNSVMSSCSGPAEDCRFKKVGT